MAAPAPIYDLMLLLDAKADDAVRSKIRADVRSMIESAGSLSGDQEYGRRTLAYEIDHENQAEYELLQFQGPSTLLDQLNSTLRITDGVVRFRIIKVRPGTPDAPDLRQAAPPAAPAEAESAAPEEPAAEAPEPEAASPADAPAAEAPPVEPAAAEEPAEAPADEPAAD